MNEIEKLFYQAYRKFDNEDEIGAVYELIPQKVVGIYRVDFVYGNCAVEIDGHEHHKTKEQREHDYKRERYLIKHGYTPIRFMGTEVFLDAYGCFEELQDICSTLDFKEFSMFIRGQEKAKEAAKITTVEF